MKRIFMMLAAAGLCCAASASWYWPFGAKEEDPREATRLHRLMQTANGFIEEAEDAAISGDADKAIGLYEKALTEFARIQAAYPERAATAEFTPLRQKAASCQAAMDAVRFEQINRNARAVAVSDTTELQRRFDEKHGIRRAEPAYRDRLLAARDAVRAGHWAVAEETLDGLEKEKPDDLNVQLLRAAAQIGSQRRADARRTLERAQRAHPDSYLPFYNLSSLALGTGAAFDARVYYDRGRALGGPVDASLEKRLAEAGK